MTFGPVSTVIVHHEGAGTPGPPSDRMWEGYYNWVISGSTITMIRGWDRGGATLNWNSESYAICFQGNRMDYPVLDNEIGTFHAVVRAGVELGHLREPLTFIPHRNAGRGSATACPGDRVMARWDALVAYQHAPTPPPLPTPVAEEEPMQAIQYPDPNLGPDLDVFAVEDGRLVHRYYQDKRWRSVVLAGPGQQLGTSGVADKAWPVAPVAVLRDFRGAKGRLDVFCPAAIGQLHAWYLPDIGWHSEAIR